MIDLYRRYDGPIPAWEMPIQSSSRTQRLKRFYRDRVLDAARSLRYQLIRARAQGGQLRLHAWLSASDLLIRYQDERAAHRSVIGL